MSIKVHLNLKFDSHKPHVQRAMKNGVDATMAACVTHAKSLVRVDTANLQGSIQMRPAIIEGQRAVGHWGSFNVEYAIYQEIGPVSGRGWAFTPYLRPARDAEYPKLTQHIRRELHLAP